MVDEPGGTAELDSASAVPSRTGEALPDDAATREDEDDYDLLTFGEARVRLDHEIRLLARRVTELEARAPADGSADADTLRAARTRLDVLRTAAARNARQPITDENFQRFFGYAGKARRNTG